MRRALVLTLGALLLIAGAPARAAAPAPGAAWVPDVAAARSFADGRAGDVSFAVRTPTRFFGSRTARAVRGASVIKAMLMVAYLNRPEVRSRALNAADRALLGPMIRRSANPPADRIFALVGRSGLQRVARAAGMRRFSTMPTWGASRITAADQTRFLLRIDERIPPRHRASALTLLRTIVPSQRWGIGRARPDGWTLHFKGGWGSGSGAVDHQVALLTRGAARVSVAVLTTDNPNMEYGNATLRGVAARLLDGIEPRLEGTAATGAPLGRAR